ncbi:Uncharacterised protein [Escherichia coli]|nr:Uncharacterised protein [Escherichia coli]
MFQNLSLENVFTFILGVTCGMGLFVIISLIALYS